MVCCVKTLSEVNLLDFATSSVGEPALSLSLLLGLGREDAPRMLVWSPVSMLVAPPRWCPRLPLPRPVLFELCGGLLLPRRATDPPPLLAADVPPPLLVAGDPPRPFVRPPPAPPRVISAVESRGCSCKVLVSGAGVAEETRVKA